MLKLTLSSSGFSISSMSNDVTIVSQHGARYRDDPVTLSIAMDLGKVNGSIETQAYALMAGGTVKYTIDKFDGTDWNFLKHQVEAVMKKTKCYVYLTTEHTKLKEQSEFIFDEDLATQAYTDVFMSLTKNVQPQFWDSGNAFNLWEKLKKRYETQSIASKCCGPNRATKMYQSFSFYLKKWLFVSPLEPPFLGEQNKATSSHDLFFFFFLFF